MGEAQNLCISPQHQARCSLPSLISPSVPEFLLLTSRTKDEPNHCKMSPSDASQTHTPEPRGFPLQLPWSYWGRTPPAANTCGSICSHGTTLLKPWGEGSVPQSLPSLFPNQPGRHLLSSPLLAAPIRGKVNKKVTKSYIIYIYIKCIQREEME